MKTNGQVKRQESEVMITDLYSNLELILLVVLVVSVIGITILNHLHFKSQRLERFKKTANELMQDYLSFYEQQNLADDQEIKLVVQAVIRELQAKGFKVQVQDVTDILAAVTRIVKENSAQKRKSS